MGKPTEYEVTGTVTLTLDIDARVIALDGTHAARIGADMLRRIIEQKLLGDHFHSSVAAVRSFEVADCTLPAAGSLRAVSVADGQVTP